MKTAMPELIGEVPNICGHENKVAEALARPGPYYLPDSGVDFRNIKSAFAIALHMHQPLIPAGGHTLRTAKIISNLKHMMDNPGTGDSSFRSLCARASARASCSSTPARSFTACGRWACRTSSMTSG